MTEPASHGAGSASGVTAAAPGTVGAGSLLNVEVVSPAGRVLAGTCSALVAPAIHGEVGILPGHAPYLSALDIGVLRITGFSAAAAAAGAGIAAAPAGDLRVFVAGGFLEVLDNRIVVLAETAERGDRVDTVRAEASRKRAAERLAVVDHPTSAIDRLRARRASVRATARLKAAGSASGANPPHA